MAGEIEKLAELATERAQVMERLQEIDDEASGQLTALEHDREIARQTWGHLLPQVGVRSIEPVDLRPTSPYFNNQEQFTP